MKKIALLLLVLTPLSMHALFKPVGIPAEQSIAQKVLAKKRSNLIAAINNLFASAQAEFPGRYSLSFKNTQQGEILAQIATPESMQIGTTGNQYKFQELSWNGGGQITRDELARAQVAFQTIWGKLKELQDGVHFKIVKHEDPSAETIGWFISPYQKNKYYLQWSK
ncbi:hypothetical protein HYX58_04715 [Candidatus Dependentiae bacterium]|nr:hypothetical protein [Candidatus Dependentiae bacterium]